MSRKRRSDVDLGASRYGSMGGDDAESNDKGSGIGTEEQEANNRVRTRLKVRKRTPGASTQSAPKPNLSWNFGSSDKSASTPAKFSSDMFGGSKEATALPPFKFGSSGSSTSTPESGMNALAAIAQQQAEKWKCEECFTMNKQSSVKCAACEKAKPGSEEKTKASGSESSAPKSTPFRFGTSSSGSGDNPLAAIAQQQAEKWKCEECFTMNKQSSLKCAACEKAKPGSEEEKSSGSQSQSQSLSQSQSHGSDSTAPKSTPFHFGSKTDVAGANSLAAIAQQQAQKWKCEECFTMNKQSSLKCAACEKAKPGSEEKTKTSEAESSAPKSTPFHFGSKMSTPASTPAAGTKLNFSFTPTTTSTPANKFQFGTPTTGTSTPGGKFQFGTPSASTSSPFVPKKGETEQECKDRLLCVLKANFRDWVEKKFTKDLKGNWLRGVNAFLRHYEEIEKDARGVDKRHSARSSGSAQSSTSESPKSETVASADTDDTKSGDVGAVESETKGDSDALFKGQCKVFEIVDGKYDVVGLGTLTVDELDSGKRRILLRASGVGNIVVNSTVLPKQQALVVGKAGKDVRSLCAIFQKDADGNRTSKSAFGKALFRFRDKDTAEKFANVLKNTPQ